MTTTAPSATATTVTTHALIGALRAHLDAEIHFLLNGETLVHGGYHLTEVKAVTYETMDCGGMEHLWRETVVQLWLPAEDRGGAFMTARKFLAIYDRVTTSVPVRGAAEIRFEYGDEHRPAVVYPVQSVTATAGRIVVELTEPAVVCKARERRLAAETQGATLNAVRGASCCAPATEAASTASCCG